MIGVQVALINNQEMNARLTRGEGETYSKSICFGSILCDSDNGMV